MSIGSLQSNPWATSQSSTGAPGASAATGPFAEISQEQATFSTSASLWSDQNAAGTNVATLSPANLLQSLASDIQAMLIQTQSTSPASGVSAGTTANASPGQNAATDLQTLMGDIQSAITESGTTESGTTQSGTTPNAQTANSDPTAPAGQTAHHHHHHHHGDDDASGAREVANAATSSDGAVATSGSQLAGDQAASSNFATDIAQAVQAYGGAIATAAMPALMV
jgi:hypothetical protein